MKIFRLVPVDPSQPDWEMSTYRGVVVIRAINDMRARSIAAMTFSNAVETRGGRSMSRLPWRHADLVACHEISDAAYAPDGGEEVLVPGIPADDHRRSAA